MSDDTVLVRISRDSESGSYYLTPSKAKTERSWHIRIPVELYERHQRATDELAACEAEIHRLELVRVRR